jgi:type II secretory ATPase GspE/PulE/Tfp pilus assembly ATPase PilB-like protein
MARAVATPASRTLTLERTVSFVLPEFVQVEVPGDFGATVATLLAQPADVALVEDARSAGVCLAAFASAERGTLVLAGLGFSTNATALAHLMTLDVPRLPFLAAIRGLVHVRRLGARKRVEVLPMTDALRRELGARAPDGHR